MRGDATSSRALGELLTSAEAEELAARIGGGQPLSMALTQLDKQRAARVRILLEHSQLLEQRESLLQVLHAIAGARAGPTTVTPVWTTPANLAQHGQLTTSVHHYIDRARESVICSTFNFQRSSTLWESLSAAARRPEVSVRVYMDTEAADSHPARWKPTTRQVTEHLRGARVLRTREFDGKQVRNHAKFIAIDHQFLIVTSANFSKSAEQQNVELGLVLADPRLTQTVELQMSRLEKSVYEHAR